MLLRTALLAGVALAVAACGGGSKSPPQRSTLPPGCTPPEAQAIVTRFLAHPRVAPADFFGSYRSRESDGRAFSTTSGPAAVAYAARRHAAGERDRLLQLQVFPVDINHVRIRFTLTRFAPDFAKRGIHMRIATGTGTLDCAHGLVAGWSQKGP